MVADGRMPDPKLMNNRVTWDKWEVDEAFSALPTRAKKNPFDAGDSTNEDRHA